MPLHIRCEPGDVAETVLLVGDPGRARTIAGQFEKMRIYNEHRGLLGCTGSWRGRKLSVQTTGMGGPSAAIVLEELAQLGARSVIRLGTCGGVGEGVEVLDMVIATGSVPLDGTTRQYLGGEPFAPVADFTVMATLVGCTPLVERRTHVGLMMTQDAFYQQGEAWRQWRDRGVLAVEMEAATIFTIALLRGLRAGAVCLVVDQVGDRSTWASDDSIAAGTKDMIQLGLEAATRLAGGEG